MPRRPLVLIAVAALALGVGGAPALAAKPPHGGTSTSSSSSSSASSSASSGKSSSSACPQAPAPGAPVPPLAPRDPLLTQLGLDAAWTLSTGKGVTVGVVDSGVDPSSPKLAGAVETGLTFRTVDSPAVYSSTAGGETDCDGHGTEVAGIIAGRTAAEDDRVSGVAPDATIYPVGIQGDIGQAPSALIAAAIRAAAEHASVINLSFAQTTDSPDIRAAVRFALGRDVVVVAAASNESGAAAGGTSPKWYPAAYPGVLAVNSVDSTGAASGQTSSGSWISVAAPGDSLTTEPRGGKGFVTVSGTSFATAIVSGVAALIRARYRSMSAPQVVRLIETTAVPPGDGRRDDAVGFGVVDPFAALTAPTSAPATTAPAGSAGRVPVRPLARAARSGGSQTVLGWTAVLGAAAILVALGTLSVRSGRRRRWQAGELPRAVASGREPEAHPAELG